MARHVTTTNMRALRELSQGLSLAESSSPATRRLSGGVAARLGVKVVFLTILFLVVVLWAEVGEQGGYL